MTNRSSKIKYQSPVVLLPFLHRTSDFDLRSKSSTRFTSTQKRRNLTRHLAGNVSRRHRSDVLLGTATAAGLGQRKSSGWIRVAPSLALVTEEAVYGERDTHADLLRRRGGGGGAALRVTIKLPSPELRQRALAALAAGGGGGGERGGRGTSSYAQSYTATPARGVDGLAWTVAHEETLKNDEALLRRMLEATDRCYELQSGFKKLARPLLLSRSCGEFEFTQKHGDSCFAKETLNSRNPARKIVVTRYRL